MTISDRETNSRSPSQGDLQEMQVANLATGADIQSMGQSYRRIDGPVRCVRGRACADICRPHDRGLDEDSFSRLANN